jgi:hypothetical protein
MTPSHRFFWLNLSAAFLLVVAALNIFTPDSTLVDVATKEVYVLAVPVTLVPIVYTTFFPWWKTSLGRALFIKSLGLAALVDLAVTFDLWGQYLPLGHAAFDVYTIVTFGVTYQLVVMVKIWWQTRSQRKDERYHVFADSKADHLDRVELDPTP